MTDWYPIESAPLGEVVLTYNSNFEPGVVSVEPIVAKQRLSQTLGGGPMRRYWVGFADDVYNIRTPTHWMPLPAKPF